MELRTCKAVCQAYRGIGVVVVSPPRQPDGNPAGSVAVASSCVPTVGYPSTLLVQAHDRALMFAN